MMELELLVPTLSALLLIGGLGWKLHSELYSIRTMLEVFMARAEAKWEQIDKLEKRVKVLEEKTQAPLTKY